MKRMFLSLALISGISLQAVQPSGSKDPIQEVGEFAGPNLEALPNWKRVLYMTGAFVAPAVISLATANTRYRFVGPPFGAACAGGLLHKMNKVDKGRIPAWQTHSSLVPTGATAAALSCLILQLSNTPGMSKLSLGKQLAYYFTNKR